MSNFPLFGSFALLLKQKSNKSRGPLFQHSAVAIFKPDDFASSWSSPDFASSWILLLGSLAITWGRQQESDRCGQPVIKQFESAQSAQAISAQFCTILQLVIFAQFLQILSDTSFAAITFSGGDNKLCHGPQVWCDCWVNAKKGHFIYQNILFLPHWATPMLNRKLL